MSGTKRMVGVENVHSKLREAREILKKIALEHPEIMEEYRGVRKGLIEYPENIVFKKLFSTMIEEGHNQYSVWTDGLNYTLRCISVEGDVDYGSLVVSITSEEYDELYAACTQSNENDVDLRTVATYIFYKKTKK